MTDVLQYKNYLGSVSYSSEDEVFYGKVLGLHDLVSFEGSSVRELKKNFQEAVDDYVETCTAVNKVPESTHAGSFQVHLPAELHRQVELEAREKGMSLNEFVRYAVSLLLNQQAGKDKQRGLRHQ